jgi:hypothetical protein
MWGRRVGLSTNETSICELIRDAALPFVGAHVVVVVRNRVAACRRLFVICTVNESVQVFDQVVPPPLFDMCPNANTSPAGADIDCHVWDVDAGSVF